MLRLAYDQQVNSIECPWTLQYALNQSDIPMKNSSSYKSNYISTASSQVNRDTSSLNCLDGRTAATTYQTNMTQGSEYQYDWSPDGCDESSGNRLNSVSPHLLFCNDMPNSNTETVDSSRLWNTHMIRAPTGSGVSPASNLAEQFGRSPYNYGQGYNFVGRQQNGRPDVIPTFGTSAMDSSLTSLVGRHLPAPVGCRVTPTLPSSDSIGNCSSPLRNQPTSKGYLDQNPTNNKFSPNWIAISNVNRAPQFSETRPADEQPSTTIDRRGNHHGIGALPMSYIQTHCLSDHYQPSSTACTSAASTPGTDAQRSGSIAKDFPSRNEMQTSKNGIAPNMYTFTSDVTEEDIYDEDSQSAMDIDGHKYDAMFHTRSQNSFGIGSLQRNILQGSS